MFGFNRSCLDCEFYTTDFFHIPIAINANYLAITNVARNRVSIYYRNFFGQWQEITSIVPPKDSFFDKHKEGFGIKLQLEGDLLAIISGAEIRRSKVDDSKSDSDYYKYYVYFQGIYTIKLNQNKGIDYLDYLEFKKDNADGYKDFCFLFNQKITRIKLPKNKEERFGYSSAIHNNLLLVGSPTRDRGGRSWLFDLNALESEPRLIAQEDIYNGTSVAISESFAVMSDIAYTLFDRYNSSNFKSKILVKSLKNGSTSVIERRGKVFLSKNILAVMLCIPLINGGGSRLSVYRLNHRGIPKLIFDSGNYSRSN